MPWPGAAAEGAASGPASFADSVQTMPWARGGAGRGGKAATAGGAPQTPSRRGGAGAGGGGGARTAHVEVGDGHDVVHVQVVLEPEPVLVPAGPEGR